MAQYDDSTFLEGPLPHPDNPAREDIGRIRSFLDLIDDALANQADAITSVDEAVAAEVAARDAAIALAVANAVTALVNGAATDVDTLGEIAARIAGSYYTKTEVDDALAPLAGAGSHTFTVDTDVATGDRLALKSNGHVEVVAGTRIEAAVGADATITSISSFCDVAFNAAVGKIAVLYYDTTYKVVIGSISANTITWGTPVSTGVSFASSQDKIVWSADGGRIFVVGRVSTTSMTAIAATVSGTVPTFGSSAAATVTTSAVASYIAFDTTGSRLIVFMAAVNQIVAFSVSGTALTPGTAATLTVTSASGSGFFDEANSRFIWCCTNGSTLIKCAAATFSGTTATPGTEVTVVTTSATVYNNEFAIDANGKVLALYTVNGGDSATAFVISFSGTVPSAGTPAVINTSIGSTLVKLAYDSAAAKFVCNVSRASATSPLLMMMMATISGTSVSFSAVTHLNDGGATNTVTNLLVFAGSTYAIAVSDPESYGYRVLFTSWLSGGVVVAGEKFVYRADELSTENAFFAIPASNKVCIIGYESTASTSRIAFVVQLPSESTNAGKFVGVSQEDKTTGEAAKVTPKGSIASVPGAGLTIDAEYYLAHDGALTTTATKVRAGRAISATELQLTAA